MSDVKMNGKVDVGVDLDAAGAAREEKRDGVPAPYFTFRGERFDLEREIPFDVYQKMGKIAAGGESLDNLAAGLLMGEIVEAFLGDRWPKFKALNPSLQDIVTAYQGVFDAYRVSLGESQASPTSSRTTGAQPKPRSKRATG